MNLEELKKQLEEGKLTQEEYDQKVTELEKKEPVITDELKAFIEKQIQSATDKVRTEYVKKLTDAEKKIETLEEDKKKGLSAKELAEYEAQKTKEEFEKERTQFLADKNKFEATKLLTKYNLIDEELKFLDFVTADTVEAMELRCKQLNDVINANVEKQVNERFKTNGRDIGGSGGAGAKTNDGEFGKSLAQTSTKQTEASQRATDYYFGNK